MKTLLTVFAFVCISPSVFSQRNIDVLHYKYDLILSDDSDIIKGIATIRFKQLKDTAITMVTFDLTYPRKDGKGMSIDSICEQETRKEYTFDEFVKDKLTVLFWNGLKSGEEREIKIYYKGIPSDGLIISKNKYGHRTFFADNWPNRGHNWIPCIDDPSDKATVEFIITAPQHYQVVANGIQIEETNLPGELKRTHWKEDAPIATKVMVIGVADFAVNLAGTVDNCIPVSSWVYPEDRDKGFHDYAQAMEILPFFIKNVGSYGYKKLANVQSKTTFGGLENANTIFYHENSITGDRKSERLMTHEIAHQWFGNMVTEKSFAHLWLSEGFATYMAILYFENKYGIDTARYMLEENRDEVIDFVKTSDRPVIDETSDYMKLLNNNSYQKGGWILHMLRRQLGDSIFYKAIRTYYSTYAGKNADTRDLQLIFEKVSGKNLSQFFQQWLYTPGIPQLDIKWNYLPAEKKVSLSIRQLQKTPFNFPLELVLKNAGGKLLSKTIQVSEPLDTYFLPVKERPSTIELDPNTSLLFSATVSEKN
jgi:aminopeptidase N